MIRHDDDRGFTLIEILFVLLIVGFLTVISLEKWDQLVERHGQMALFGGVAELNARETMLWAKDRVSKQSWRNDVTFFSTMDTDLGRDFEWLAPGPSPAGGRLSFQGRFTVDLERRPSTAQSPGRWTAHDP